MEALKNIIGSPKSSFKALLLSILTCAGSILAGVLGSAVNSAAGKFASTGNVTDWKPYAAAGIVGAVTFLGSGALRKDIEPIKTAIADALPIPGLLASPVVNKVTNSVMQAGLTYMTQAATSKLQSADPELAAAVQQALSAHSEAPVAVVTPIDPAIALGLTGG